MERIEKLFTYLNLLNNVMVQMDTEAAITQKKLKACEEIEKELGIYSPSTITVNINNESGKSAEEFIKDRIKKLSNHALSHTLI